MFTDMFMVIISVWWEFSHFCFFPLYLEYCLSFHMYYLEILKDIFFVCCREGSLFPMVSSHCANTLGNVITALMHAAL